MKKLYVLILLFPLIVGCNLSNDAPDPGEPGPGEPTVEYRTAGTFYRTLGHEGLPRDYIVHVPEQLDKSEAVPLMLVLHGATGNAQSIMKNKSINMNETAELEGFIAAYPEGTGNVATQDFCWNAMHCCGSGYTNQIDDIGYLQRLIDELVSEQNIDTSRIYMIGHSNGAMMSHRFAAEQPHYLAGIAAISGTIGGKASATSEEVRIQPPASEVPVLIFHGLLDLDVPYNGGAALSFIGREDISAPDSAAFWVQHNNCVSQPVIENGTGTFGDYRKESYAPAAGTQGAEVVFYTMMELEHQIPKKVGETVTIEIIWEFFSDNIK
ncbi:MAG: hypothetical protein GY757_27835 [bacterium]|nr:hypothetical protein [bacterium]